LETHNDDFGNILYEIQADSSSGIHSSKFSNINCGSNIEDEAPEGIAPQARTETTAES